MKTLEITVKFKLKVDRFNSQTKFDLQEFIPDALDGSLSRVSRNGLMEYNSETAGLEIIKVKEIK